MDEDFLNFWAAYPRRVAKADAMKAWGKLMPDQRFAALQSLPIHIRYWQFAGTAKEFLPYPASWLRGQRWEDELEMPNTEGGTDWMKTASGIEAQAKRLNVQARPGEDHASLKARVLAAMR